MQNITIKKTDTLDFQGSEAYKTLRSSIQFSGEDVKVICLTSCLPNEGKSVVSMNLAVSLAEAGKRVLLVDADMRKSMIAARYKLRDVKYGLSHYLSGQCDYDEVIGSTNIDNLYMILSGPVPPNPSELLEGKRFQKLLTFARGEYDYILVDCPPLGSVVDALIVGRLSDGVALVISSGEVSYKFVQRIQKQLEMAECKILGVILNKVSLKNKGYYGKYYSKYYGKYYGKYDRNEE